jgi:copper transport protein
MSIYKIILFFSVILFIFINLNNFDTLTFAQVEITNNISSSEAVTSINDALLKSMLIISQVAVLGIIFNHFFFNRFLNKKRNNIRSQQWGDNLHFNDKNLKRLAFIVILCCASIVIFSTGSILLQSYQLAQNLNFDMFSAFDILYTTSVGQVWLLRIITSLTIIGIVLIYTIYRRRKKTNEKINERQDKYTLDNKYRSSNKISDQIFLLIIMVLSSVNLFSNSMVSHSNSLSSLSSFAVSIDWIHFMAVSIWIGGLFYLSSIILKILKSLEYSDKVIRTNNVSDISRNMLSIHTISIALMYFSFIAIVALCIIGISGIYLGYIHLQSINSVFGTLYGQILIIKLGLAFPLIFMGRYNQLKIYKHTLSISNILKDLKNIDKTEYDNLIQPHTEKRTFLYNTINKSLKLESLLGISVLIVAAFLSVTSPPSLDTANLSLDPIQNNSNTNTDNTDNSNNSYFLYLVIVLSAIISVIGIVNFRKNQKQMNVLDLTN